MKPVLMDTCVIGQNNEVPTKDRRFNVLWPVYNWLSITDADINFSTQRPHNRQWALNYQLVTFNYISKAKISPVSAYSSQRILSNEKWRQWAFAHELTNYATDECVKNEDTNIYSFVCSKKIIVLYAMV